MVKGHLKHMNSDWVPRFKRNLQKKPRGYYGVTVTRLHGCTGGIILITLVKSCSVMICYSRGDWQILGFWECSKGITLFGKVTTLWYYCILVGCITWD